MQVFSSLDVRIAMPHETNLFSTVNRDFRILMKVTEKNPNVLQACSRISKSNVRNIITDLICFCVGLSVLFQSGAAVRHVKEFFNLLSPNPYTNWLE